MRSLTPSLASPAAPKSWAHTAGATWRRHRRAQLSRVAARTREPTAGEASRS